MSIQRQPNTFRRVSVWLARPEQELVRKELAWLRRWAFSPGRWWLWLGVAAAMAIQDFNYFDLPLFRTVARSGAYSLAYLVFSLPPAPVSLLGILILAVVVERRALRPFGKGRLAELLTAPLSRGDLWPSLLAAPAAWGGVFSLAMSVATLLRYVARSNPFWGGVRGYAPLVDRSLAELPPAYAACVYAIAWASPLTLFVLAGAARGLAQAAFMAAFTLPSISRGRAFLMGVAAWTAVNSPFAVGNFFRAYSAWGTGPSLVADLLFRVLCPAAVISALIVFVVRCRPTAVGGSRPRPNPRRGAASSVSGGGLLLIFVGVGSLGVFANLMSASSTVMLLNLFLFRPLLSIAASAGLFSFALGRLRSDGLWDRLRERADREG